jgi:hypothetical protein
MLSAVTSLACTFSVCRLKMVLFQTSEKATCQAVTAELDSASFSIGIANLRLATGSLRKNQGERSSHMPGSSEAGEWFYFHFTAP